METIDWQQFYPFLFGAGWIIVAMLAFWLGRRSGKKQERVSAMKLRWKQRQTVISHYRKDLQSHLLKIEALEQELKRLNEESESYEEKLADIAHYRQKILICEQQIKQLSAEEPENVALSLLYKLKDDPTHTNPSRQEWDALFALTDILFNRILMTLSEKYGLTRHEQEICCLLKWEFNRKEQLAIFNNTSDALTKSKQRLKKKLQLDDKSDLELFIRSYL